MKGKVHVFGDDIDTDIIAPGGVLHKGMEEIVKHSMEAVIPEFYKVVKEGDIIIAGRNFGGGSSREQAPLALKKLGISIVLARSFSRLFYRNAVNVGLNVCVLEETVSMTSGDSVEYSIKDGTMTVSGRSSITRFRSPSGPMKEIIDAGGLIEFVKQKSSMKLPDEG